jgi:raffinose/stachyose/melibiose transport system substrate-binding protein
MKKNLKQLISLILSIILIVSMTACSKSTDSNDNGSNSTPTGTGDSSGTDSTSDSSSSGDKIVLTLSHNWVEGSYGNGYIWDFINQYEKDNPNVDIQTEAVGHDDYEVRIATEIASADVPDIFEFKGGMLTNVINNGLAMSLDDVMKEDPEWTNSFKPGLFNDFTTSDGTVYAFPVEFAITTVLYYNKNILKEVGYDAPPTSWNDFLVLCDKLNEAGYVPVAFGNAAGWPVESDAFSKFANNMTGTDWFKNIKYGKGGSFTDPEFISSLDMLKEAYDRHMFNEDINTLDYSLGVQMYEGGKAAMMMDGSWTIGSLMTDATKEIQDATEFSFFPFKDGGKGDPKAVCGGAGWGMGINSKLTGDKLKYAIDFCKKYFGPDQAEARLQKGAFPATTISDYSSYDPMIQRYMTTIVDQYTDLAQCYSVHLPTNLINVFYNGLQDFMVGSISSQEYAQELQDEYGRTDLPK